MKLKRFIGWLLVLAIPALFWSTYIYVSRMTRYYSVVTDYLALAVAIAIGVIGVLMLVRATQSRTLAAMAYVVVAGSGMYWGMVTSLCYVGDCP